MTNSDQIKEAPEMSGHSRQIFQNFTDATIALLDSPECPPILSNAISSALENIGNDTGAHGEYASDYARRVLSQTLNLTGEETAAEEEADIAARELANAFAAIEQYCEYLPARVYRTIDDGMMDFIGDSGWPSKPDVMRKALPHILRAALANGEEEETARSAK
ncbi:MAG: hypothetical protein MOB07_26175 [Acidobacteria bacterium]|nr:hypothetical protein [Acidobacteriota bacterium]